MIRSAPDSIVIGAGPNGLAAAIALSEAGRRVRVLEANEEVGGAARTSELTIPGYRHDLGSAIHPLAVASPFFRRLPLADHGLEWIRPELPLAHPLDGGRAVLLHESVDATTTGLGSDGPAWGELFGPLVAGWPRLEPHVLRPLLRVPRHPVALGRFGLAGLRSAEGLARKHFADREARALFAGLAAHSALALDQTASASFGLVLGILAHRVGWPFPRGGAGSISEALAGHLRALGGEIITGHRVESLAELERTDEPLADVIFDLTPRQVLRVLGSSADGLADRTRHALERYRYGPAAFKLDWALESAIPWANPDCARAGTLHLGGTLEEIAASEKAMVRGRVSAAPFVLLAQHTRFDPSRAPVGRHTAWAYCHVPNDWVGDMTDAIENQVERFAPGFRDRILERHVSTPADLERLDSNLVGGDINGGAQDLRQILARPRPVPHPYRLRRTADRGLYICSSSTPPGGGVHGMCGWNAAQTVLRDRTPVA